uniref:Large ribosomal subunit protein uL2 RNA-binding domain-containing protein n=1 Tax=Capsella bursa-pastoris TaxID=3719 RepID=A0A6H1YJQ2_CAPBU|nr:hypothetical protein [Capsella bursa-pastoris]
MRPGRARALRQFTLSTGKSAGRNSSGRITVFHRGGGSKRLLRRIDLKRSASYAYGVFFFFIFFIAPKLWRILLFLQLALSLVRLLVDPGLFVVPNLDLPPSIEGNEIVLNTSVESLYNDIESSASVRARNLQLEEGHEQIQDLERALENEGDPGRRRELGARLDQAIRAQERLLHLARRADSIRDRQIAEWRRRFDVEYARAEEECGNRAFLNFSLRVLIHAQEHQPPRN